MKQKIAKIYNAPTATAAAATASSVVAAPKNSRLHHPLAEIGPFCSPVYWQTRCDGDATGDQRTKLRPMDGVRLPLSWGSEEDQLLWRLPLADAIVDRVQSPCQSYYAPRQFNWSSSPPTGQETAPQAALSDLDLGGGGGVVEAGRLNVATEWEVTVVELR